MCFLLYLRLTVISIEPCRGLLYSGPSHTRHMDPPHACKTPSGCPRNIFFWLHRNTHLGILGLRLGKDARSRYIPCARDQHDHIKYRTVLCDHGGEYACVQADLDENDGRGDDEARWELPDERIVAR